MALSAFGWDDRWSSVYAPFAAEGREPARVACELRRRFYAVQTADEELLGECMGSFFHRAESTVSFPAVGDWVVIRRRPGEQRADIEAVLPRRTTFSRRAAGDQDIEQVVAANVDLVLLVSGLDRNFNPARIQRFLVAARESGAEPVIVLNKTDLHPNPSAVRHEIEQLVPNVNVVLTSTTTRRGLKALAALAVPGKTLALVGSSGVGKSSLVNALMKGEAMPTAEVREKDSKGRHTTTRRELVLTPQGAVLIDTPGLRELQLWDIHSGIEEAFADVAALAASCRFTNCTHQNEPGCAVRHAIENGTLPATRLDNYRKLSAEQAQRTAARRRSPSSVANDPGWRRRRDEAPKPGRIRPDDEEG